MCAHAGAFLTPVCSALRLLGRRQGTGQGRRKCVRPGPLKDSLSPAPSHTDISPGSSIGGLPLATIALTIMQHKNFV